MTNLFAVPQLSKSHRAFRVLFVVMLLLISQNFFTAQKADASILADTYILASTSIAFDIGTRSCGYQCGVVAAGVVIAINTKGPVLAESTVEYIKPGLIEMFTNWGTSFFRY